MTQPQDSERRPPAAPPTTQLPPIPPPRPTPARRSCASQLLGLLSWLLTLALSVLLALAAVGAILYFYFGVNLATPDQIRRASNDVVALQTEVALSRTAEAERVGDAATARERIDELEQQVADYEQRANQLAAQAGTAAALGADLDQNIALAATIQAEGREGQVLVAVVATVQAENSSRIGDLQQRTDRLLRFLQRLGDIAGDATLDAPAPPPTTPTATPTADAPTPTPTAAAPTPTPTAAATVETGATPEATPTTQAP